MQEAKRKGRPRVSDEPLTSAERQKRYQQKKKKEAERRLDAQHQATVDLLKEALHRIERPSPNINDYPMQAGGAWWRLQQVMEWLAPHVEKAGEEHCFAIHGYPEERGY